MKKLKAYFDQMIHCNHSCKFSLENINGGYAVSEPWFRIGPIQIWHVIKIACVCGKVFYDIEDL